MSIAEVRSLPLREKLQILEVLWDDLSVRMDGLEVTLAERELLDARIKRVENGSAEVYDWDSVKHSLGRP